ncbi:hypothetical protein RhiJN_23295 [Ceratobasidium sp. AG-Ba]|nr:hypothetical protein RhiJN_23295 [Ceratobasidium sp. AG-Ba]
MVQLDPRFRGLLVPVTLAFLVQALPPPERRPLGSGSVEESLANRDRLLNVMEVGHSGDGDTPDAASEILLGFENEPAATDRREGPSAQPPDSGAPPRLVADNYLARPRRYHHQSDRPRYGDYHHDENGRVKDLALSGRVRTPVRAEDPIIISGNDKHIHVRSRIRRGDQAEVQAAIREAVGLAEHLEQPRARERSDKAIDGSLMDERDHNTRSQTLERNHHGQADDTSKGGHSDHWYKHHLGRGRSRHSHHQHNRMSRLGPRRVHEEDDDEAGDGAENTFIVPASLRVKPQDRGQVGSTTANSATLVAPNRAVKNPQPAGPTGLYRAVRPIGVNTTVNGYQESQPDGQADEDSRLARRGLVSDEGTTVLAANSPSIGETPTLEGFPGVIELVSNGTGAKIGTLSISPATPHTSPEAYMHNATALAYLIDATMDPADHATFYLRKYDNQTLLHNSPDPQGKPDLLVSLQAPHEFAGIPPLCAAFNPDTTAVQMFGLVVCSNSSVATNGGASQTWRYSPETGQIWPFFDGNLMKASETGIMAYASDSDEVDYLDSLDYGYSTFSNDLYSTNPTPTFFNPPSPLMLPRASFNGALNVTSTNLSPSSAGFSGSPELDVESSSDPTHAFIIGDSEFVTVEDHPGAGTEGAILMFRRTHAAPKDVTVQARSVPMPVDKIDSTILVRAHKNLDAGVAPLAVGYAEFKPEQSENKMDSGLTSRPEGGLLPDDLDEHHEDSDDAKETPVPKPMINVAYFGDSGRSPPVPPDAQAPNAKSILLAFANKGKNPATFATPEAEQGEDIKAVYLVRPKVKEGTDSVMRTDGGGFPLDASD